MTAVHQFCIIARTRWLAAAPVWRAGRPPPGALVRRVTANAVRVNNEGPARCGFSRRRISRIRNAYADLSYATLDGVVETEIAELAAYPEVKAFY